MRPEHPKSITTLSCHTHAHLYAICDCKSIGIQSARASHGPTYHNCRRHGQMTPDLWASPHRRQSYIMTPRNRTKMTSQPITKLHCLAIHHDLLHGWLRLAPQLHCLAALQYLLLICFFETCSMMDLIRSLIELIHKLSPATALSALVFICAREH